MLRIVVLIPPHTIRTPPQQVFPQPHEDYGHINIVSGFVERTWSSVR
jgi:hypothetical protein